MSYTETSFSQAIFQMFENLDSFLVENYTDLPNNTEAIKVYLFGGCAVHLHTGSRATNSEAVHGLLKYQTRHYVHV